MLGLNIKFFLLTFLVTSVLFAEESSVVGCSSTLTKSSEGCESKNILEEKEEKTLFKIREESVPPQYYKTNITQSIKSVGVKHKGKRLEIIRKTTYEKGCPPHCIAPITIDGVKSIGELEVLDFLKEVEEGGDNIVFDTRESKYYNKGTIPGALNLPAYMLEEKSRYFDDIITLLGIKKVSGNWQAEGIHNLLIFDNGITDNKALKTIKRLLKLSYPADKILYYRGGVTSWSTLGLTLYKK